MKNNLLKFSILNFTAAGLKWLLIVSFISLQLSVSEASSGHSKQELQRIRQASTNKFIVRSAVDMALADLAGADFNSPDEFLKKHMPHLSKKDRAEMKVLLKDARGDFKFNRIDDSLHVSLGEISVVFDVTELRQSAVKIDGVRWIFHKDKTLAPQIKLMLQRLKHQMPSKYGMLDEHDVELHADGELYKRENLVAWITAVVRLAPAGAKWAANSPTVQWAANKAATLGGMIVAGVVGFRVAENEKVSRDASCEEQHGNRYKDIKPSNVCYDWSQRQKLLMASAPRTSPLELAIGSRSQLEYFDNIPTKCPTKNEVTYRAFVRSRDQICRDETPGQCHKECVDHCLSQSGEKCDLKCKEQDRLLWRYFVAELEISADGNDFTKSISEYPGHGSARPHYNEPVPSGFEPAARKNTPENTPKRAKCKQTDRIICCEMPNPLYQEQLKQDPLTAFRTIERCISENNEVTCPVGDSSGIQPGQTSLSGNAARTVAAVAGISRATASETPETKAAPSCSTPQVIQNQLTMYRNLFPALMGFAITCSVAERINESAKREEGADQVLPAAITPADTAKSEPTNAPAPGAPGLIQQ